MSRNAIGTDPEPPGAILEQRINRGATDTVRISWIVPVVAKTVAVVASEAIRSAKPNESLIVLYDVVDFVLQLTLFGV